MQRTPVIRRATIADALQLAQLAERTFVETFGEYNTPEDLAAHVSSAFGEGIQGAEIVDPNCVTLLCHVDEALAGFAQLRWDHAPPCVSASSPGEIHRFYVDSAWHGLGVAQTLMRAAIDEFSVRGNDVVWLGVWEHNPRAQAFYKKVGFNEVGEHTFVVGTDPQRDVIMVRAM